MTTGKLISKFKKAKPQNMSFAEAIKLGEYDPDFLSSYEEWVSMSPHTQLQSMREGMDNRRKQLLMQWAELDRAIDASIKPGIGVVKKNIEVQLRKIEDDRERYYLEFTSKM